MSTAQPDESRASFEGVTPDGKLHTRPDTAVTPEDLVLATGRDVTPDTLRWAERKLATEGSAAMEKLLP
ncbi:hypothetical protein [Streptomyces abyssomicinicus]|uniref:hypothetical protein n=1 Tax=Streptomyces abyssomicinicus TaxID=574929 RepID=UPI00124FA3EA|nr:hypothetical protein [Streptomyces abyssomicinicus]